MNAATNQIVLDADGTFTGTLSLATLTASRVYTLPDIGGEVTLLGQTIALASEVIGTLPVGNGGTGATSHTDGAILLGNVAGAITNLGVLADDTLVLGDGVTDPGTALVPDCDATDDALNYDVTTNAFTCQTIVGSGGGAPANAQYVVLNLNPTLTAERLLTGTANQIIVNDGGPGGNVTLSTPQDIHSGASPTFVALSLNADTNQIVLDANNVFGDTGTITLAPLLSPRIYTFPDVSGEITLLGQTISQSETSDLTTASNPTFATLNLNAVTNQIVLDADGTFTGTITLASLAASRVYTLPDETVTLAGLELAQEYTAQQNFNATTLTDGVNISWDLNTNQVASVTLAGNRTLDNPTNQVDGSSYTVIVRQDATGSRTLAYGTAYLFSGGVAPILSTGVSAVDILTFISDGTNMFGVIQKDFS